MSLTVGSVHGVGGSASWYYGGDILSSFEIHEGGVWKYIVEPHLVWEWVESGMLYYTDVILWNVYILLLHYILNASMNCYLLPRSTSNS